MLDKLRSCGNDGEMDELTMRLYCARAARKEKNGQDVYAMTFMYGEEAEFYRNTPSLGGGQRRRINH